MRTRTLGRWRLMPDEALTLAADVHAVLLYASHALKQHGCGDLPGLGDTAIADELLTLANDARDVMKRTANDGRN